jgi:hypothetical protein
MYYRLTEWEVKASDGSDFFVSVYDALTNTVKAVLASSTRGSAIMSDHEPDLGQPITDPAILEKALLLLTEHIYMLLRSIEHKEVYEPVCVDRGAFVRLTDDVVVDGKVLLANTVGQVYMTGPSGPFFTKGHSLPGRQSTRVGISLTDGSPVVVPLSVCRLEREPEEDDSLHVRARLLARNCEFSRMTGERCSWDACNHAKTLFLRMQSERLASANLAAA